MTSIFPHGNFAASFARATTGSPHPMAVILPTEPLGRQRDRLERRMAPGAVSGLQQGGEHPGQGGFAALARTEKGSDPELGQGSLNLLTIEVPVNGHNH